MFKKTATYLFLISLLSIFATQVNAQKSITGIVTEEISTKDGKFLIHRTTHLPKGKTISGTVIAEPKSDKAKKREKQIKNLAKYILKIGDQIIGNDGIFTINLPDVEKIPLKIFTLEGKLVQEIPFELSEPVIPENLKLPKTIRKDIVEKITGDFSGDITNANLLLNEKPIEVLAGNDTELFFKAEDIEPGKQDLSLKYDDVNATETINVVDYTLQAGRLNLQRGESTYLDVKVVGLEDIQEPLRVDVQNQSVGTVSLEGGDLQSIEINPDDVADDGTWEQRINIQSVKTGSFSILTNIEKGREESNDCCDRLRNEFGTLDFDLGNSAYVQIEGDQIYIKTGLRGDAYNIPVDFDLEAAFCNISDNEYLGEVTNTSTSTHTTEDGETIEGVEIEGEEENQSIIIGSPENQPRTRDAYVLRIMNQKVSTGGIEREISIQITVDKETCEVIVQLFVDGEAYENLYQPE